MHQPINVNLASAAVPAKTLLRHTAPHPDGATMSNTNQAAMARLALVALQYARAVGDRAKHKEQLRNAYRLWCYTTGTQEFIARDSAAWVAMMQATSEEYRQLRNAKSREYRAQKKLLRVAARVEGLQ